VAAMVQQHGQWVAFKVQVLVILVLIDFGFDHSILLRTGWVLSLTYTCDDILHVVWLRSVALWKLRMKTAIGMAFGGCIAASTSKTITSR